MIENNIDMNLCEKIDLIRHLPIFYRKLDQMKEIQKNLEIELSKSKCVEMDCFLQSFVETATWGLKYFEQDLGLDIKPNLSIQQRREVIKGKLRGTGTTTVKLIKNVSIAFSNGEVEVIEDNENYIVKIKFVGTKGIPANIEGLKYMLTQIIPAHLGLEYIYIFITWGEVKNSTWGQNKIRTWKKVKETPII